MRLCGSFRVMNGAGERGEQAEVDAVGDLRGRVVLRLGAGGQPRDHAAEHMSSQMRQRPVLRASDRSCAAATGRGRAALVVGAFAQDARLKMRSTSMLKSSVMARTQRMRGAVITQQSCKHRGALAQSRRVVSRSQLRMEPQRRRSVTCSVWSKESTSRSQLPRVSIAAPWRAESSPSH